MFCLKPFSLEINLKVKHTISADYCGALDKPHMWQQNGLIQKETIILFGMRNNIVGFLLACIVHTTYKLTLCAIFRSLSSVMNFCCFFCISKVKDSRSVSNVPMITPSILASLVFRLLTLCVLFSWAYKTHKQTNITLCYLTYNESWRNWIKCAIKCHVDCNLFSNINLNYCYQRKFKSSSSDSRLSKYYVCWKRLHYTANKQNTHIITWLHDYFPTTM